MSTRKSLDAQHQGFFYAPARKLVLLAQPAPPVLVEQGWQSCRASLLNFKIMYI